VSLVAILDADKEGFLRSERSLVQMVGRAARNVNGKVIMYADRVTKSMQKTIDETNRRRGIQKAYNDERGVTPQPLNKSKNKTLKSNKVQTTETPYVINHEVGIAADPVVKYMNSDELAVSIERVKKQMVEEAKKENFIEAAALRDEMFAMKKPV